MRAITSAACAAIALASVGCVSGPTSGSLRFAVPLTAAASDTVTGESPVREPEGYRAFAARVADVCGRADHFTVHRVTLTAPAGVLLERIFAGPIAVSLLRAERPAWADLTRLDDPTGETAKAELDEPADDCQGCRLKLEAGAAAGAPLPAEVQVRLDLTAYCATIVP